MKSASYSSDTNSYDSISLKDYVNAIRKEFIELRESKSQDKEKLSFRIEKITVELSVTVQRTGNGSIEFKVFKMGGSIKQLETQKIIFDMYIPRASDPTSTDDSTNFSTSTSPSDSQPTWPSER